MTGPVFPAATPAGGDGKHPPGCACLECIDALIAEMSTPLVIPRPRRDPALADQPPAAPPAVTWLDLNRPTRPAWPEANRATRGPGTGGGAGRRPSGPGRRRGRASKGGICGLLVACCLLAWTAGAGLVWLAIR